MATTGNNHKSSSWQERHPSEMESTPPNMSNMQNQRANKNLTKELTNAAGWKTTRKEVVDVNKRTDEVKKKAEASQSLKRLRLEGLWTFKAIFVVFILHFLIVFK